MWKTWLFPSLLYLGIALLAGTWLRLQWTRPEYSWLDSAFLIHAHSHVALLGWLFLALLGLIASRRIRPEGTPHLTRPGFQIPLHLTLAGMTVAFALQGYAPASIALSTVFILLSFWCALVYLRFRSGRPGPLVNRYFDAAVAWMVLSSVGPLALAGGGLMGTAWIDFWVRYYLHLQFNGWILFALMGLVLERLSRSGADPGFAAGPLAFRLLLAATLPSLLPSAGAGRLSEWLLWTGFAATSAALAAVLLVTGFYFRHRSVLTHSPLSLLADFAMGSLALKTLLQTVAAVPPWTLPLIRTHLLSIGFTHLLLLGFATLGTLYLLAESRISPHRAGWNRPALALLLPGTGATIGLLFYFGSLQLIGSWTSLPVQPLLLAAGAAVVAGWLLLTIALLSGQTSAVARGGLGSSTAEGTDPNRR